MTSADEQNQTNIHVGPPSSVRPASPAATRQRFRLFTGGASIVAALMLVLLAHSLAAYHVIPLGVVLQPTTTPTALALHGRYTLVRVAMVSADDVWAIGFDNHPSGQHSHLSVFLHFDGVTWKRVPTTFDYRLNSIAMLPSGEGWAVGASLQGTGTAPGVILHYTGGRWAVETLDHSGQYEELFAITMISADEGWAVGTMNDGSTFQGLILHYLHGRWTRVSVAGGMASRVLRAISMSSRDDGWIVGSDESGKETSVALHYRQGEWQRVAVGADGPLYDVSALSADEAWAVGTSQPAIGPGVILHYRDGIWHVVPGPTSNILHAITMRTPTEGWVSGDGAAVLHYDGVRWTQVSPTIHGVGLLSIAVLGADGWATGTAVLLRLHSGVWAPYVAAAVTG